MAPALPFYFSLPLVGGGSGWGSRRMAMAAYQANPSKKSIISALARSGAS